MRRDTQIKIFIAKYKRDHFFFSTNCTSLPVLCTNREAHARKRTCKSAGMLIIRIYNAKYMFEFPRQSHGAFVDKNLISHLVHSSLLFKQRM